MGNEKLGLSFAGWMWALKREKEAEYYKVNYCDEVKFTYDIGGSIVRSFFQDYENSPELLEIAYTCLFTNWPWVTHSIGNRDNDKLNINFNEFSWLLFKSLRCNITLATLDELIDGDYRKLWEELDKKYNV